MVDKRDFWNQEFFVKFNKEIDPFKDIKYFRSLNEAYDGKKTFWSLPSPEPNLPDFFLNELNCSLNNDKIKQIFANLVNKISKWEENPERILFISILRAGVPIVNWLCQVFKGAASASISLFVGLGIDKKAFQLIKQKYPDKKIIFIDGWTGKGGVCGEIQKLNFPLAVLNDPWKVATFAGTHEDLLCPSAFFTGASTLGFSRTFFVNEKDLFQAYLFPLKYFKFNIVETWQKNCPQKLFFEKIDNLDSFFKNTNLRVHSNEVARALINAAPEIIYFFDDLNYVKKNYKLLLLLSEIKMVKIEFKANFLKDYRTKVACLLKKNF